MEDVPALFSGGGDDGADAGEGSRAGHGSEAAGDFHLDLHHPQVALGLIVGEGDGDVREESQHIGFALVQPDQEIVSGAMGGSTAGSDLSGERRLVAMEGKAAPDDGVVAFDQGAQNEGRQRRRALGDSAAHGAVGLDEKIAHLSGPLLFVDVDQGFEFAQMMGVAQRVADGGQRVIGPEMIVDDDPAAKALGQFASFGRHPIRGQGHGRGGMEPLALAGDAKAGFVEMAHGSLSHQRGDLRRKSPEVLGLPLAPGDDAVGTKRRCAEQVGHRLGDPILGNELLNIEINRRRPDRGPH